MQLDAYLKENYHFCPRCGASLANRSDHLECASCGFIFYYNPAPTVALLAFNDQGEVLLNRRKHPPYQGDWDTVGGFVDHGESIEAAIKREFKEETQGDCELVKYWGSAPDFYGETGGQTINLFFEVKVLSENLVASDDAFELKYFPLDQLPDNIGFKNAKLFLAKIKHSKGLS